jgi:hypothetical protein
VLLLSVLLSPPPHALSTRLASTQSPQGKRLDGFCDGLKVFFFINRSNDEHKNVINKDSLDMNAL